ncbi:GNAT family N-acyltransferase [Thioclava sp. FR2]|uniref:GNAT family N-acyltransferase n=1 Tax=Thioclava sp. FR2 TaxID=3445780 RepID=UPI003EBAC346
MAQNDVSFPAFRRGKLVVRLACSDSEVRDAQRLRYRAFANHNVSDFADGFDADDFDAVSSHVLVLQDHSVLACYRLRLWQGGQITQSYTGKYYDLSPLEQFPKPMLELGRFCVAPGSQDPDVLRLAWAAMTAVVDSCGVGLLFGCTSFHGADPRQHAASLALLRPRIGPEDWRPRPKSAFRVDFADLPTPINSSRALSLMPALLRSYLGLGGWVSDHAVIDQDLDTLHVFTGVEIEKIPPERARALRAITARSDGVK